MTVRDDVTVTMTSTLDGSRPRRRAGETRPRTSPPQTVRVAPVVMLEAQRRRRPGQRLILESATAVLLVNGE